MTLAFLKTMFWIVPSAIPNKPAQSVAFDMVKFVMTLPAPSKFP